MDENGSLEGNQHGDLKCNWLDFSKDGDLNQ
jgi:hypothetical protein